MEITSALIIESVVDVVAFIVGVDFTAFILAGLHELFYYIKEERENTK